MCHFGSINATVEDTTRGVRISFKLSSGMCFLSYETCPFSMYFRDFDTYFSTMSKPPSTLL